MGKWGNDALTAFAICRRDKLGYQEKCQSHDVSARNLYGRGYRFMLAVTGTAINPRDQSIREQQMIWIAHSAADKIAAINAATPEGADYLLSAYSDVSFTTAGAELLKAR